MEKIYNYKEKEKLPKIYTQSIKNMKSLTPNIKNHLINSFDHSLYDNKVKIRNKSYYENNNINNNNYNFDANSSIKNYLKISVNKDKNIYMNSNRSNVLTYYNNNNDNKDGNIIFKKSKENFNDIIDKLKNRNNLKCTIFPSKTNNNNDLFSGSYYRFILNLKMKKEANNNIKNNENIKEYNNNNNNESKTSNYNTFINNHRQYTIENQKTNSDDFSLSKDLEKKFSNSKSPTRIKLLTNNLKNNNYRLNNTNKFNALYLSNNNYCLSTNNNNNNNTNSLLNNSFRNKKICTLCHKEIDCFRFRAHINAHPSKIFNWCYLGSYRNACNVKDLKDLNINYILNCAIECENKNLPSGISCYHAKINDSPYFQIQSFFDKTNSFINKAKVSGGNILIHCQLGISRSTTCLIAYMIKYLGYTTLSAIQFIKKKRSKIMPNFGFIQQLKNYENKIRIVENKNENAANDIDKNEYNNKNEKNFDIFINQIIS